MESNLITNLITSLISKLTGFGYNTVEPDPIPLGVSNRHLHLSAADLAVLFGAGYELTQLKPLSQPGQFAAKETVTVVGPRGAIESVRVLGPVRKQSQVELLRSDCFRLGIQAPLRESGSLKGSASITLVGPKGTVVLSEGAIVAKRHIHMAPADAAHYGVADGQVVAFRAGGERGLVYDNVVCRVNANFRLEAHLDMDEANAADLKNGDPLYLIRRDFAAAPQVPVPEKKEEAPAAAPAAPDEVHDYETLITEEMAKTALREGKPLYAAAGAVITPLAKDVIHSGEIEVIYE